jgi:hypothetical protein
MKTPIHNTGYISTYLEDNVIKTDYEVAAPFDKPYINYDLIDNVVVEGIDFKDYPDFTDAFISSADYNGKEMTDEMLDMINEDYDYIYDKIQRQIF